MARLALRIAILCVGITAQTAFSDQVAVSSFKYLNSNENSAIIDPSEAQDLLNVDITPGGKSIKKRPGYGVYKSLGTSQGVHGGYHFFDSSGNDVMLWGSSTTLKGIVADGAVNTIISSATLASTWDCTDTQGSAYCVNSNRDGLIKTNGVTFTSWAAPNGTMVEATPDRLAIAGVTGALSSIYVSASNSFLNYTVGPLTTDPFIEPIAAPGSKLTHIRWACGKLLWWKDQSFGYMTFEDQFALSIKIVSDNIGTFDNTSAVDPGGSVWFRGQEGNIWRYDCSSLTKESIEITPFVQASGRRTSNFWTQSSQTEFETGSSSPTNTLSTRISVGEIVPGSFTVTENSSASGWGNGTASNMTVGTSSISLSTNNSGTVAVPDFESAIGSDWTGGGTIRWTGGARSEEGCTLNAQNGSSWALANLPTASYAGAAQVIDTNSNVLTSVSIPKYGDCTWRQYTLSSSGQLGKRIKLRFVSYAANYFTTVDSYIWGGDITFWAATPSNTAPSNMDFSIDNIQSGVSTITEGSFTSQAFNTGLPYSFVYTSTTWTSNTPTPSFVLQKSADGSAPWTTITTSTGINVTTNMPYLRYLSTITVAGGDTALSYLSGVNILARSSGTYFSAVKNASSLTAWSTFNPTWTDNGDDINFYIRSSTSPFYVLNSSPPWTAQTPSALVSASTGTYFQVIASFTVTAATNTPSALSDFIVNWFDGSSSDQAYMLYFDNAIWASVAYGTGVSSNTYVFKRDLINDGWTVYNFGVGGMLVQNNRLFFGDVSPGANIFQYGSGTSDNSAAINAYWKSKDFTGQDPFLSNQLTQIDTFAKQNSGQSLTATYALDTSTTTTSYAINLSSTTQSIVQNRKLLPAGKNGYVFNIKFSDNTATSSWELFGFRIGYVPQTYRPSQ